MNHIYIIEDDSVLCSELALALEAVGYHTTCANDFNNVLNEFLLVSPDLVILDINLPNTDGFILCMKIRKVSQVPIIFITGRDSLITLQNRTASQFLWLESRIRLKGPIVLKLLLK